ncbi:hypothetical protein KIPB_013263, partial [Kipferlia bialata]|eukprot:g13263.t1
MESEGDSSIECSDAEAGSTPVHQETHTPGRTSSLAQRSPAPIVVDDEDGLSTGGLYKRADFVDREDKARSHPNRRYYYRKNEDVASLISECTSKLEQDPKDIRALFIRSSALIRAGDHAHAEPDLDLLLSLI